MTDDLNELAKLWLNTKVQEKKLTEERRKIEDRIKSLAGIPENLDGTEIVSPPGYEIKIAGRIDRKVDANKLQEIAEMNDMIDHLSMLFRSTPDVNVGLWKKTSTQITNVFAPAITVKAGRPSFKIEEKE